MQFFGKPLRLVILDVDGTILDLWACFRQNLVTAAQRLSLPIEPIDEYLTNVRLGTIHGEAALSEGVRKFWPWLTLVQAHEYSAYFREEEQRTPYPPVPGAIEAIQWLRAQEIPIALCTTNDVPTLEYRLYAAGIDPLWFAATSTGEYQYRKPDPRAFDPIFEKLGADRETAVYIGDWYPDVEAARGAGITFVAVLSGGIPRHAFIHEGVPEDHIVEGLSNLPNLIAPR